LFLDGLMKFGDLLSDPGKFFNDLLQGIIKTIINDPIVWMLETLVQNFKSQMTWGIEYIRYSQTAAIILVTIFFMIRILNGMKDNITGENNANFAEIMGSYLVSYVFIFATPYIVTNFLMKVSSQLLQDLSFITLGQQSLDSIKPDQGFEGLLTADKLVKYGPWLITFIMVILFIGFCAFTLSAAVLNVELGILLIIGPLVATSFQNRTQTFRTYWTECIAVVFTRNLQLFLFLSMIGFLKEFKLLYAFGVLVVAIRGPQVLRQYLHGQGSVPGTNAVMGAGRLVAYRTMFRSMGK
jgi:hypothetical protein